MTTYHGGKQKIGKYIAETMSEYIPENEVFSGYLEPFCGMCGVYDHAIDMIPAKKYIASDINKSIILMWKKVQKGWKPPKTCDKETYDKLKYNNKVSAQKGYLGHVCSYRGTYFDTYFNHKQSKLDSNYKNVIRLGKKLEDVTFYDKSYDMFHPKNYVIYCDPPYASSTQRYYEGETIGKGYKLKFDSETFWKWCKKMAKDNYVFVSEYSAPKDDKIVQIYKNKRERLYMVLP
jgi:site-specific DNA-adenine methylase